MQRNFSKILCLIVLALLVAACGNNGAGTSGKSANPQFDSFRQNFTQATLPLTTKACYVDPKKYTELTKTKYPFFIRNDEGSMMAWCTFKTNGDYTALFTFGPADCYVPYLTTYDKDGKKIDEKMIAIGGCGSDCGFTCEEYMIVNADYSIYTSDTVITFKCDTAGNVIPGTKDHYVIYKMGKLLSTGKIELSGEMKEQLKD